MVSMKPALVDAGPADHPIAVPASKGLDPHIADVTTVIPYNNAQALEEVLKTEQYAAFIVEPAMENIGICLPMDGYLEQVRAITQKYGTVLIFDEVKTGITSNWGGATTHFGVKPDLVCLAKSIGGGLPIGAFGGRREIMEHITNGDVLHLGTYNGNPLVMAAAMAVLRDICTKDALENAAELNRSMLAKMAEIIRKNDLPAHTVQLGAKGCITWSKEPVRNYRDYKATDFDLAYAQWLWGINRGILLPPGLDEQWLVSVQHTEEECDVNVDVFEAFVAELT
jgi:glutamate-1-semialdehyde 2,1-aminomutase